MKYSISIQYRPRNSARPQDEGTMVDVASEGDSFPALPNIGDHIGIALHHDDGPQPENLIGVVENRLFSYPSEKLCLINIVITDSDTDAARLIKE